MIKILYSGSEEGKKFIKSLEQRAGDVPAQIIEAVDKILSDVKANGDISVVDYTRRFDSKDINIDNLFVSKQEIFDAYDKVDNEFLDAINLSIKNVREFHEKQKRNSFIITEQPGVILGQTIRALDSVGVYVPGGTASYPSSVVMNVVPAKVAGVKNIVMTTPPLKDGSINPYILVVADMVGVDIIYKAGGAQAIGALAFGTKSLNKVDKIVGPGNIYVAMAKRAVFGYVNIDMIAGPSEILIIADNNANPKFIAADLMSQAEHDLLASAILITTSYSLAEKVKEELSKQIETLKRKDIIKSSLKNFGGIIVTENIDEAIVIANEIAPEHLELMVNEPFLFLGSIKNAGSVFIGQYSPEPLGDYMAGPNHVLPTSGTARFFSPLSVDDFIKKFSYINYTEDALCKVKDKIVKLAEVEGLTAHANSIKVRFNND